MNTPGNPRTPTGDAEKAAAGKQLNAGSFATGLSAWLGGIAFCIGVGLTAPTYVAAGLTVLSVAISGLSFTARRRGRLTAAETQ
jgi:DHA1 family inner membrane transport protein